MTQEKNIGTQPGKVLVVLTVDFPFGNYEASFLPQEIAVLKDHFKTIYLLPLQNPGTTLPITLPENVVIFDHTRLNRPARKKSEYNTALALFLKECFSSGNFGIFKHFKYHFSELLNYSDLSKKLSLFLEQNKLSTAQTVFYTYWFDSWNSSVCLLKKKKFSDLKLITRAHGYDLYEDRNDKGYIFPRRLQLKYTDKIYSVSANGAAYLKNKYPFAETKVGVSRLGTTKTHASYVQDKKENGVITLASCSSLIPLKRVHKIVEVLMQCTKNIHWTHFGDGELMPDLKNRVAALPANIRVELKGNTPNDLVTRFYSENQVDWFMNVSEYEGIPVSIMEALSYGIPVIATNVGGVSEIVTATTGRLIAKDFNAAEVAHTLQNEIFNAGDRSAISAFWEQNYSAETNYRHFAEQLLSA